MLFQLFTSHNYGQLAYPTSVFFYPSPILHLTTQRFIQNVSLSLLLLILRSTNPNVKFITSSDVLHDFPHQTRFTTFHQKTNSLALNEVRDGQNVGYQVLITKLLKLFDGNDDGHPHFGGFDLPPVQFTPFCNCKACRISYFFK